MPTDLLSQILPSIKDHMYPTSISLPDWKLKEGDVHGAYSAKIKDTSWKNYTIPAPWGGFDKTVWFRKQVSIPEEFAGKEVALVFDLREALVYVNGRPYQGIDQNHHEVFLTNKARTNQTYLVAIEAYGGRTKELSVFGSAKLVVLNSTARALYHGLNALHELEKLLGPSSSESKEIRELIRQTLIFLKYFKPEGEEYPNAIGRAYAFLTRTIESEYKTDIQGLVHLVAHSHIDVVWLWRLRETIRKCGRTFSTALRLMDEFPEFNFTQSQALLYELTRENYPELYKEIKQRISEGRWHAIGSTWVEPDCNIPNGESLVRQIVYGKRFFKKEFGIDSDVLWLPDTFGYNWSLPQILKKSGIKYFATTKLTWNDTNKFPHNTFWWQGVDGSKILTHLTPVGLEALIVPKDIKKSWDAFHEQEQSPHVLQTFGYGDGGGGPTKEHTESARVLKTIVGLPPSTLSSITSFFKGIEEQTRTLPVWSNELYLEKHRGTYTTLGWVKKANRLAERSLYNAELLAVLGLAFGKSNASHRYPQQELEGAWKKLLLNQFHDIIPGTAIADAYEDVRNDFDAIQSACTKVQHQATSGLIEKEKKGSKEFTFSIFNPLSWTRSDYATLSVNTKESNFLVLDEAGNTIPFQLLGKRDGTAQILCYLEELRPFSFKNIIVTPLTKKSVPVRPWKVTNRIIETSLFRTRLDSKGQFSSIFDKTLRREILAKNGRGNRFQAFKDQPKQWDAWDIDPEYQSKELDLLKFKSIKVIEEGPLRATIRISHESDKGSKIAQDVSFYHKLPRIDFRTWVWWKERQTLLKVAFPFNVKTNSATYEIQFGALQRGTKTTDPWQRAKYEVPAQQWADMAESKFGVSLLNDSKYGYDAKESTLRLTLLRSPFYPHPTEPWRFNDDKVTDQGEHTFTYSLLPHAGDWRVGESTVRAKELNNPFIVFSGKASALPPLLSISGANVMVDAVKKAEDTDEVIVRAHEAHGHSTKVTIEFGAKVDQVVECDLMEQETTKLNLAKRKLAVKFSPFEIKTLKLKLRARK